MLTELPELTVGEYKRAERPQTFKSLVAVLLSGVPIDWCSWQLGLTTRDLASLVDEILQQVALILGQKQDLGLLDDIAKVSHKMTAFFRELGRGTGQGFGCDGGVQGNINLFVLKDKRLACKDVGRTDG